MKLKIRALAQEKTKIILYKRPEKWKEEPEMKISHI